MKKYALVVAIALVVDLSLGFSTTRGISPKTALSLSHHRLAMLPNGLENEIHHIASGAHGLMQGNIFQNLLESYTGLLRDHPVTTKALTASCLAVTGDAIAQRSGKDSESEFQYDTTRAVAFAVFAAFYTGAFQHFWFSWLDGHVNEFFNNHFVAPVKSQYGWVAPSLRQVQAGFIASPLVLGLEAATKVCTNQFLMVPLAYMPLFFAVTGTLSGLTMEENLDRAKNLAIPLLMRNYAFWLPVQFIQFYAIDPKWQIPYLCVAGLVWNAILSSVAGNTSGDGPREVDPETLVEMDNDAVMNAVYEDAVMDAVYEDAVSA